MWVGVYGHHSFFKCDVAKKELKTAALDLIWLIICVTLVGSTLKDFLLS